MKLKCKRCGYEWEPRIDQEPRQCPHCKSPSWNKERVRV
jgi:predicted Zn-ribbon and HTH transcriptional regulator